MIKKIHYIWLGSELPFRNKEIVDEWQQLMMDFEIVRWSEKDIEIYDCLFLRQCLRNNAFAFAADYLRLRIIFENGGFYLDTDMKLIKRLDVIDVGAFMIGEENDGIPNWAIFYAERFSPVLKDALNLYDNLYFDQFNPPIIPTLLLNTIKGNQEVNVYSKSYFYPFPFGEDLDNFKDFIVKETVGVHLWDFSWKGFDRTNNKKFDDLLFIFKTLVKDLFRFEYPIGYFKVNLKRAIKLLIS